jgi:hypothetical protein
MVKAAKIFLGIQAVLYPLVIFCCLVFFKLSPRVIALFVGFIALGYFLSVSAKKKSVRGLSYSPGSYNPWPIPCYCSSWGSSVL